MSRRGRRDAVRAAREADPSGGDDLQPVGSHPQVTRQRHQRHVGHGDVEDQDELRHAQHGEHMAAGRIAVAGERVGDPATAASRPIAVAFMLDPECGRCRVRRRGRRCRGPACPAGVRAAATRWPTRPSVAAAIRPARTRWWAADWSQQQRPSRNRSGSVPSCSSRPACRHGAQDRSVASAEGARGGHGGLRGCEAAVVCDTFSL